MKVFQFLVAAALVFAALPLSAAEWAEGYTEPNRTIRVATCSASARTSGWAGVPRGWACRS